MASMNTSFTVSTVARHEEAERQRSHTAYSHQGKPVCTQIFHTIGTKRLKNLLKSYKENSLSPRVHGNTKRKPKHALSYASTEYVARFLHTYPALLLPGRIPGYNRSDIQLLPSSGKSGGCIIRLLKPSMQSMLLHTPRSHLHNFSTADCKKISS